MKYGILLERVEEKDFPSGHYYAHVPALGLTTHGLGVEGAREAALDLLRQWVAEKRAHHEAVPAPTEFFFSTVELPDDARTKRVKFWPGCSVRDLSFGGSPVPT